MIASDNMVSCSSRGRMILLVDDEQLLLDVLGDELEELGYRVLRALTGEEALRLMRDQLEHIDLLVTDIRLPGSLDGWGIAEEARRLRPDLAVIYVTGYFSQASREVPGGLMILKPYRPSAIVTAARKLWAN